MLVIKFEPYDKNLQNLIEKKNSFSVEAEYKYSMPEHVDVCKKYLGAIIYMQILEIFCCPFRYEGNDICLEDIKHLIGFAGVRYKISYESLPHEKILYKFSLR